MRVTRLNVAGEIAVAVAVVAVLVYELIVSGTAARTASIVALLAGASRSAGSRSAGSRGSPPSTGKVQLAIALARSAARSCSPTGCLAPCSLLLCAFAAGFLATALFGLRSGLRAQGGT